MNVEPIDTQDSASLFLSGNTKVLPQVQSFCHSLINSSQSLQHKNYGIEGQTRSSVGRVPA